MSKLFFSYSHKNENIRNELEVHLSLLKRQKVIETWHDRKIDAGQEFDSEICHYLDEADIILLLISPYFLASDYCYDVELSRALDRHERKEAVVIPVILDPCDWKTASFGKITATPSDGKPISTFKNIHEAFLDVTTAIRKVAEKHKNTESLNPNSKILFLDEEERNKLFEHEKILDEFDEEKSKYVTQHKLLTDWLSKNNKTLVERIFIHVVNHFEQPHFNFSIPKTSKEIRKFKRDISQNIRHFEVCLLEGNTGMIDEPAYMLEFNPELYRVAYTFLFSRIPESVSEESKKEFKSYIDYLLKRI